MSWVQDLGVGDLVNLWQGIEVQKANRDLLKLQMSAQNQYQTLMPPEYPTPRTAMDGGNVANPANQGQLISGVDNKLIYGGGLVLSGLLLFAVTR